MKGLLIGLAWLLAALSMSALGADQNGKFAVKGAGKRTCADFVKAMENKSTDYYLYGGWLEGFISSYNQHQPNNYDITPWQTTELMLSLLQHHCLSNPESYFLSATNGLIKTLFPIRLDKENNLVKVQVGNGESYFYQEILMRAKARLKVLGLLENDTTPDFDRNDAIAFEKYQKSIGLEVTGMPDQKTLVSLFLKRADK